MKRIRFSKFLSAYLIIAAIVFFAGCASRSEKYGVQPFGAIGQEADVYVFAPVLGNRPFLHTLFTAFVPEETAHQYLNRTSALYIGVRYGAVPGITVSSAGSYPVSVSGLLFSQKDGWEKRRSASSAGTVYYYSQAADVVLQSKTAFALLGNNERNTEDFLQRIVVLREPVFPLRFRTLVEIGGEGEIGLYARSGSRVASVLFGLQDMELPIRSIEVYLKKHTDVSYRYSAVFEAVNVRAASILKRLLGTVLKGTFYVQESSVFVENADISEAELIALFRSVVF